PQLNIDPNGFPLLTDFDISTLDVMPSLNDPSFPGNMPDQLGRIAQRFSQLPTETPPSQATADALVALARSALIAETRAFGSGFLTFSDALTAQIAETALVKTYFDRPRLILASSRVRRDPVAQTASSSLAIDLRRDHIRSIPFPGQNQETPASFNTLRGI